MAALVAKADEAGPAVALADEVAAVMAVAEADRVVEVAVALAVADLAEVAEAVAAEAGLAAAPMRGVATRSRSARTHEIFSTT